MTADISPRSKTEMLGDISAIILAGGRSSRMGSNKAELIWNGDSLIAHQVRKMRSFGIGDVILAGYQTPVDGARCARDIFPGKGPLGGIHAGLLAAKHELCLVLSVDAPLVPKGTLSALISAHIAGQSRRTVLSHGGFCEPLIGVYERCLSGIAEDILKTENTSVRVLFEKAGVAYYEYSGDEALLSNCNTPEEYKNLLSYAGR